MKKVLLSLTVAMMTVFFSGCTGSDDDVKALVKSHLDINGSEKKIDTNKYVSSLTQKHKDIFEKVFNQQLLKEFNLNSKEGNIKFFLDFASGLEVPNTMTIKVSSANDNVVRYAQVPASVKNYIKELSKSSSLNAKLALEYFLTLERLEYGRYEKLNDIVLKLQEYNLEYIRNLKPIDRKVVKKEYDSCMEAVDYSSNNNCWGYLEQLNENDMYVKRESIKDKALRMAFKYGFVGIKKNGNRIHDVWNENTFDNKIVISDVREENGTYFVVASFVVNNSGGEKIYSLPETIVIKSGERYVIDRSILTDRLELTFNKSNIN